MTEYKYSSFTVAEFLLILGGSLGIWTGASLVSLVHALFRLMAWLGKTMNNSNH